MKKSKGCKLLDFSGMQKRNKGVQILIGISSSEVAKIEDMFQIISTKLRRDQLNWREYGDRVERFDVTKANRPIYTGNQS